MSKKGLSAEDKRVRLLDLFKETREFYKLQELEKLAPKLKGITQQSVKDVLQELVNDDLVMFEKVGISNFYWCFPSDVGAALNKKNDALEKSVASLKAERDSLLEAVQTEGDHRQETEERSKLLERLAEAKERLVVLETEDAQYSSCDPRMFAKKEKLIEDLKRIALGWTENISAALWFVKEKHGEESRDQLKELFSINDTFEELSFP